jgi:nicotinate-nucleotide pyrophosphorylase (carboxylating)
VLRLVRLALEEDLGRGDITTAATISPGNKLKATISAREHIIVAGLPIVEVIFELMGAGVEIETRAREGKGAGADSALVSIRGDAVALLAAERVLLNFLQRMSGVATLTRRFVEATEGTRAEITDTRKTIPGWRLLDKYAVRMGGGRNHRFGLDDGILIKDNHIVACGGIAAAVALARRRVSHLVKVEVECDTLEQVDEALAAHVDAILLDNMSTNEMCAAVKRISGRALVEASGGMTLERVPDVAATGVQLISVGAITHSARAVDLGLELEG